jgi:hypothetical protein
MKQVLALILLASAFASANTPCDRRTVISGTAAQELYQLLNLPEIPLVDNNNILVAHTKTGTLVMCRKMVDDQTVQCSLTEPFTGHHCN